jgi:ribonuclease HI
LPAGIPIQKSELISLIRALTLEKGKRLHIYTDSKSALLVLHTHAAIWRERGLLSGRESPIRHRKEILQLLESIHLPKEMAVIHCQGHQRNLTLVTQRNNQADQKAKQAAPQPLATLPASILTFFPPKETWIS